MVLVLLAVAVGVTVAYTRGGRLRAAFAIRPIRSRLVLTAFGLYVAGIVAGWSWQPLLPLCTALSILALSYFAWLNRALPGARLVAVGLLANAVVLLVNGATPVSRTAAVQAGITRLVLDERQVATTDAMLPWLGKVVPVAFPPLPQVVSPGDIAVAAGLMLVMVMAMGRRPARTKLDDYDVLYGETSSQAART